MGSFHFTALNPNRDHHSLKLVVEASFSSKVKLVEGRKQYCPPPLLLAIQWPHRGARTYAKMLIGYWWWQGGISNTRMWHLSIRHEHCPGKNQDKGSWSRDIKVSCRFTHTQKEWMPKLCPVLSHLTEKADFFSESMNTETGTICLWLTTLLIKQDNWFPLTLASWLIFYRSYLK